jgi:hypothetical protein
MPTDRQGQRLPVRLDAVRQDDVPSLHTIAVGIDRDIDAVIVGLSHALELRHRRMPR